MQCMHVCMYVYIYVYVVCNELYIYLYIYMHTCVAYLVTAGWQEKNVGGKEAFQKASENSKQIEEKALVTAPMADDSADIS